VRPTGTRDHAKPGRSCRELPGRRCDSARGRQQLCVCGYPLATGSVSDATFQRVKVPAISPRLRAR